MQLALEQLEIQNSASINFQNDVVDRKGLITLWEFSVIDIADLTNTLQRDLKTAYLIKTHKRHITLIVFDCFCSQESELCWSGWQESNEGL